MSLTNPKNVVTEERLNEYHQTILPYLGGNSMVACGGGYAPIGTVIAYMGTRAPSDFLICDGTVYNIADYTELANFFELQFGSANFFGGDGNTTFAVPDLRGEFLRGTGTNSHANQGSGANVGVHQDATLHPYSYVNEFGQMAQLSIATIETLDSTNDYKKENIGERNYGGGFTGSSNEGAAYTSRPTNTSVLYCIKAKSQGNGYSLDEQIVGTWIDGKPIYQKTIIAPYSETIPHNILNVGDYRRVVDCSFIQSNNNTYAPTYNNDTAFCFPGAFTSENISLNLGSGWASATIFSNIRVTIQYTKSTD